MSNYRFDGDHTPSRPSRGSASFCRTASSKTWATLTLTSQRP